MDGCGRGHSRVRRRTRASASAAADQPLAQGVGRLVVRVVRQPALKRAGQGDDGLVLAVPPFTAPGELLGRSGRNVGQNAARARPRHAGSAGCRRSSLPGWAACPSALQLAGVSEKTAASCLMRGCADPAGRSDPAQKARAACSAITASLKTANACQNRSASGSTAMRDRGDRPSPLTEEEI
jgi:hypothetical protein